MVSQVTSFFAGSERLMRTDGRTSHRPFRGDEFSVSREIGPIKNEDYASAEEIDNPNGSRSTVSSGIDVRTADLKNRDCSSSNREEDAITSNDQTPDGNTQLFAPRRDGTGERR